MAFGSGVLISAVAFDLMAEAADTGGLRPTAIGFLGGAVVYLAANAALARHGARHRKRSGTAEARSSRRRTSSPAAAPPSPSAHCSTASPSRWSSASACWAAAG